MIGTMAIIMGAAALAVLVLVGGVGYAYGRSRLAVVGGFSPVDRRVHTRHPEVETAIMYLNGAISGGVLMANVVPLTLAELSEQSQSFVVDDLAKDYPGFFAENVLGFDDLDQVLLVRRRDWQFITESHYMFADVTRQARETLKPLLVIDVHPHE